MLVKIINLEKLNTHFILDHQRYSFELIAFAFIEEKGVYDFILFNFIVIEILFIGHSKI